MSRRPTEHALRRELSTLSQEVWRRGWVANHDGNLSARLGEDRILATPTALSKRVIEPHMILVLNDQGAVIRGQLRPFSELNLHLEVYRARDVGAVLHAHPPYATARAVARKALPCFLPEAVVSLGLEVPLVPFAPPGPTAADAVRPFVGRHDGLLLANHGVLTWGVDPEQAYLRMELIEHLSRIAQLAGAVESLPAEVTAPLLAARRRAGLA
ncbi:MAG: class II aldolase/adducin family protein [Myxococcota bacterium]